MCSIYHKLSSTFTVSDGKFVGLSVSKGWLEILG
jgi:hypothetical protein